ncbi:YwgA family protein [Desulfurobacterium crinifex]
MNLVLYDKDLNRIASLVKLCSEIVGRKKLQKLVFVLKSLDIPFTERFKLHYFGPYSSDLQLELDELVLLDVLEEDKRNMSYVYTVKDESVIEIPEDLRKVKEIIHLLNSQPADLLELLATYLYLLKTESSESIARKKLGILKPHLIDKLEEALKLWEEIRSKYQT